MLDKLWDDIGFFVTAQVEEFHVDFRAYEVLGRKADGTLTLRQWDKSGGMGDFTSDVATADPLVTGSVRWDGCSNWNFPDQAQGLAIHFCEQADAVNLGILLGRLYDWTAEILPSWDGP